MHSDSNEPLDYRGFNKDNFKFILSDIESISRKFIMYYQKSSLIFDEWTL